MAMTGEEDQPPPLTTPRWSEDSARAALDDLFINARQFNSSSTYFELVRIIGRFRFYSPFNAMLIYIQMPGARFVATARRWLIDFRRRVRVGAHPILILQPMGPVLFVFDVGETEALPGASSLPRRIEHPFEVRGGRIGSVLDQTIENAKRDGLKVGLRPRGTELAGSIECALGGSYLDACRGQACPKTYARPRALRAIVQQQSLGGGPICNART
jgi:hypothetical protein